MADAADVDISTDFKAPVLWGIGAHAIRAAQLLVCCSQRQGIIVKNVIPGYYPRNLKECSEMPAAPSQLAHGVARATPPVGARVLPCAKAGWA